jgi:hypothetical protein
VGGNTVGYTDKDGLQIQSPNIGDKLNSVGPAICNGNDCANPPINPYSPTRKPNTPSDDAGRYKICEKDKDKWCGLKEKYCK